MDHDGTGMVPGRAGELRLVGGALCLDLSNTLDPRRGPRPREFLTSYGDLLAWAVHAGAVAVPVADRLAAAAARHPAAAARTLEWAWELREAIFRTFAAVAAGAEPEGRDLEALAAGRAEAAAHERIVGDAASGFGWGWDEDPEALDRPLWPVARSAAELLTGGRLDRVRECPGADDCGWLFLDTSKNGRRRWCRMEGCGNLAKSRRFTARHGGGRAGRSES